MKKSILSLGMAAVLGICTLALTTTVNAEVVTATQAAVAYQSVETAAIGIQAGYSISGCSVVRGKPTSN